MPTPHSPHPHHGHPCARRRARGPAWLAHPLLAGLAGLAWFALRTGTKPSRAAYPCQQAALGSASVAVSIALVPWAKRALAWLVRRRARLAATGAMSALLLLGGLHDHATSRPRAAHVREDYTAKVWAVDGARGTAGDHHLGVDALLANMSANGLKPYRSATTSALAGPAGLIAANDVVLIKVNQQWGERGGTSTDVLRGLIASLLEHPDGFTGEIVVVENGQGLGRFDWPASNAENQAQSTANVVAGFASRGLPVYAYLWDGIRDNEVAEYSAGDTASGYVLGPWRDDVQMRVSYPKFRTPAGTRVSLRDGVWNPVSHTYDHARLKFLTLPVLKCHQAYGITASCKVHLGTMTTALGTNAHAAIASGGLGAFFTDVRLPDLNVLDCTYVLADPTHGPACTYEMATRVDKLVASQDPVALDLWAATNVLVPTIQSNGYAAWPQQDPANATGDFRNYLDLTAAQMTAAGLDATADPAHIHAYATHTTGVVPAPAPAILAAHPNPFRTRTAITLVPERSGTLRLDVYDAAGRLRRSLAGAASAGSATTLEWDGRDDAGRALGAGTYFWRVAGGGGTRAGRVTLVR